MKILFLTDNFPPEVNAPASRTYEHCREWVREGASVTVITCAPNAPHGKVYDGYKNHWLQEENKDGIRIIRVWSYISKNKGFFGKVIDYFSFALVAFYHGLFVKTDLIVATSPQFFTVVSGALLAFFKRKPWVMEVRDLWPESISAVGVAKGNEWWMKLLGKIEKSLYKYATKIVVVTHAFKENIEAKGIAATKIAVITNGVLQDQFQASPKNQQLIDKLQLQNKFIVGYIGTHGLAHKLDFIIDCAKEAPFVHFLFIGDGTEKAKLLRKIEAEKHTNISMLGAVPKKEVPAYLSIMDVALVPLRKSLTFQTVIPSKIFECAAMKKPILLGVEGESCRLIEKYQAGLCFKPENKTDFLQKLSLLVYDEAVYERYSENSSQLAKDYNRTLLAHSMLDVLRQAANKNLHPAKPINKKQDLMKNSSSHV